MYRQIKNYYFIRVWKQAPLFIRISQIKRLLCRRKNAIKIHPQFKRPTFNGNVTEE